MFFFQGYSHLIFKNTGNHFTWRKVTTLVNNIIVGKLWIDNVKLNFFPVFRKLNFFLLIGW